MSTPPRVDIVNINFLDWWGKRPFTGGAERYVRDLARLCARMGLAPRILQNAHAPFRRVYEGLEIVGIPAATSIEFEALSVGMAAEVTGATLVIASPLELACRMPAGVPVIGINHGIWWDDPAAPRTSSSYTVELVTEALAHTRSTIAVDTNFINWLRAAHVLHAERVHYIPNYVALDRFTAPTKSFAGRLNVLFPRRLCVERGFPILLDAFEPLLADRSDLDLCLCGGGSPENEARAKAFVKRHHGRATWFERAMDDMPSVYANSHIVIIPTLFGEGTSMSCLEALATNNAVIATHVGGLPNLVIDGYNGLLIDTGADALRGAVNRLANDRSLAKQLAQRGRAVCVAFGQMRWERAWTQAIENALDAPARALLSKRKAAPAPAPAARPLTKSGDQARWTAKGSLDDARGARAAADKWAAILEEQLDDTQARVQALLAESAAASSARDDYASRLRELGEQTSAKIADLGRDLDLTRTLKQAAEQEVEAERRLSSELARDLDVTRTLKQAVEQEVEAQRRVSSELARDLDVTRTLKLAAEQDAEAARLLGNELAAQRQEAEAEVAHTQRTLDMERRRMKEVAAARDVAALEVRQTREALTFQMTTNAALREHANEQAVALDVAREAQLAAGAQNAALVGQVSALERVIAARDQGIEWLRGELRAALRAFEERRMSLKLLAVDGLYAVNARIPWLRTVARSILPHRVRAIVSRRSYANTVALRFAGPPTGNVAAAQSDASQVTSARLANGEVPAPMPPTPTISDAAYDVLCFAIIEWGARFQRPQHLMTRFANVGHRVYYIVASKLPAAGMPYSIELVAPNVYQVGLAIEHVQDFYAQAPTAANIAVMRDALESLKHDRHINSAVSLVQLPYWTPLAVDLRSAHRWPVVYDCMDEWENFPKIGKPLLEQERALVNAADLVTVTGSLLAAKWQAHARRCLMVRNGVDYSYFSTHCIPNSQLDGVRRPIIGYYGALADWVDFELLAAVARARPAWTLVLVGDVFVQDLAGLDKLPNVLMPGRRPYAEMPQFLYHFDVCMVPFKLNEVTHAVDPVKFYEYLSVGKPVVSVPLAEMQIYADYAYFAKGCEAFVAAIEKALAERDPATWRARIALAKANDWEARHAALRDGIRSLYDKISIIVVSYNNAQLTRGCIESIYRNTAWPHFEVIVVDNASADDTRAWLRYLSRTRDDTTVILNEENRGFAVANNQGLVRATGEFIVLLNNDTVVPPGWLEPLLDRLRDPDIGMAGPVTNFVGNEARIAVDYTSIEQMVEFATAWMDKHRGEMFDIRVLAMFCVAFRRTVFELVGPLDESFGVGMFEDDDYSRRVQVAGLRTVCVAGSFVHHYGQASFRKLIENGEYDRLWKRNQAIYERKWGTWTPHTTARSDATAKIDVK